MFKKETFASDINPLSELRNEIHPVDAELDKLGKRFMGDIQNDPQFEGVLPKTDSFYRMSMYFDGGAALSHREKMSRMMLSSMRAVMYDKAVLVTNQLIRPWRFFTIAIIVVIDVIILFSNLSYIRDPNKIFAEIEAKYTHTKAPSQQSQDDQQANSRAEIERAMSGR